MRGPVCGPGHAPRHDVVDRGLNGAFHETLSEKPEQESRCSTLCVGMEQRERDLFRWEKILV